MTKIIKIEETVIYSDDRTECEVFYVDADKIRDRVENLHYTRTLLESALVGVQYTTHSHKYSLSDTEFEYDMVKASDRDIERGYDATMYVDVMY